MNNALKKIFSLTLLLAPLLLSALSFIPHEILKMTPLYTKPAKVTYALHILEMKKISETKEGEDNYEVTFVNNDKIIVKYNPEKEDLFEMEATKKHYEGYLAIIVDRHPKNEDERKDFIRILRSYRDNIKELTIKSKREFDAGKKADIIILPGNLNRAGHIIGGVFFSLILFFSLALCIPIMERIIKIWARN